MLLGGGGVLPPGVTSKGGWVSWWSDILEGIYIPYLSYDACAIPTHTTPPKHNDRHLWKHYLSATSLAGSKHADIFQNRWFGPWHLPVVYANDCKDDAAKDGDDHQDVREHSSPIGDFPSRRVPEHYVISHLKQS